MTALLGIPDLGLLAWLLVSVAFAFDAAIFFLGYHYTKHHRVPRWRRQAMRQVAEPIDFEQERRVRDRTRRGPEMHRRAS